MIDDISRGERFKARQCTDIVLSANHELYSPLDSPVYCKSCFPNKLSFSRRTFSSIRLMCLRLPILLLSMIPAVGMSQNSAIPAIAGWVALDAPTGHEHLAIQALEESLDGWHRDRSGNLVKTIGEGRPHRVVACGIDSYSYAVSQITEDGYLRLHRIGSGSRHPLWDQAHEGQQLRILTRTGPLVGVAAVANGHFAAQHRDETTLVSADELWLDVGAETSAEVAEMGIQLLDPAVRQLPAWGFRDQVAGPRAGARVGCAAVAAAATAGVNGDGSTSYVLSTQQVFGWVGLGAALRFLDPVDAVVLVAPGESTFQLEVISGINTRLDNVLESVNAETVVRLTPEVSNPDALMEGVGLAQAQQLLTSLVRVINPVAAVPDWISAPEPAPVLNDEPDRWGNDQNTDQLMSFAAQLDQLAELSAVPGHEGPVRALVYDALPEWAKEIAQIDDMGNLWVEMGPPGEATVFIAHMDEVGWEINAIANDGWVSLTRLGGVVTTAWEGQPALLQLDPFSDAQSIANPPQLRGVFSTRSQPDTRQPENLTAWFGMDAAQLAEAGVKPGMGVTGYKVGYRMGAYRYSSRSLDDRVGTTALLRAIQELDPDALGHRVIFAWSVREEGGLRGAGELAKRFGMQSRRVYSIDTFVSSDTPLESPHFAYAPLGQGPVLRSIENAGMAIPYELDRNQAIAAATGINFQIGLTQGGTDGTAFTFYGAPNAGLSWPGRYSHSPAEIADLRDIVGLVTLIGAMAESNPGP